LTPQRASEGHDQQKEIRYLDAPGGCNPKCESKN
jgi:hypothetical protein